MHLWTVAAALSQAAATPPPACAAAIAAAPGKACVATTRGVVLAPDPAEATRLAGYVTAGEQRFQRHFRRPPPRTAVVQGFRPGEHEALMRAGFVGTTPMIGPAQFREAALASVRRAVEAKAKAEALPAEAAARAISQAEAAWLARNDPAKRLANEEGVVPHEAGHLWYMRSFWPEVAGRGGHYGGPGPDWMDETAAVLMGSDKFAADRHRGFEDVYRGAPVEGAMADLSAAELVDLSRFLSRDHPGAGRPLQLPSGPMVKAAGTFRLPAGQTAPTGPMVRVMVGEEARATIRGGLLFYLQSRLFADFLIERTGDQAIFADIGAAFGRGETMAAWLAAEGARHQLPVTIAALDREWRTWLTAKFGPLAAPKGSPKPAPSETSSPRP